MDLDQFQAEVTKWAEGRFGQSTGRSKLRHLLEEAVELLEAEIDGVGYEGESADILLILLHFASSRSFSLMAAARAKFDVVRARRWAPPDDRGVVRHVRTQPKGKRKGKGKA